MINDMPSDYRGQERQNSRVWEILGEIGSITQITRTAAESESYGQPVSCAEDSISL